MEPRSVAYVSGDAVFKDIYDSGKDAYMELAKVTWPQYVDRPDFKSTFRIIAKNCMISKIYGRGNESLAKQADVPVSQVADMERALFSNWKDVARYRAHKMNYLKTTGNMETYLGDRLRGDKRMFYTTARLMAVNRSNCWKYSLSNLYDM